MNDRIKRINEGIREVLSRAIYRIVNDDEVRTAEISFVSVSTSNDLRNATVLVSIMNDATEAQRKTMGWIIRHRADFQRAIADDMQLKYTPRLTFRQTDAIENGARVLGILDQLASKEGDADAEPERE